MLTTLLLLVPAMLSIHPAAAASHDRLLRDRLDSVRELLDRRQAHHAMLTGQAGRLSDRLDQLRLERERSVEALADQQALASAHERELDRLIPRLLPRLARLDRFRKSGARTIAGLASMERHTELADRTRTRLLASQAASIEQMRTASTALRRLRRVAKTMTARHRDIDFRIPLLTASFSRLDLRLSRLQRRRDAAIRDLADLSVDLERLTTEEHRLARNMIARSVEATERVDIAADSLKAVLTDHRGHGKATIRGADVRGIALRQTQPTPVARPLESLGAGQVMAASAQAPSPNAGINAKSGLSAKLADWAGRRRLSPATVASFDARADGHSSPGSVENGDMVQGPPLLPNLETIGYTEGDRRDRSEISIAAMPGQQVAAPRNGRVVFAGDFRSYGLLLIIEHGNGYHTLLWGFSSLDIEFGDTVRTGQIIGVIKNGPSPKLHVELRRNGQPVSPEMWLAASNSGVKG